MSEPLRLEAHAKLNAFLRVLGARDDGYHEIQTVILPIDLADVVTISSADGLTVEVEGGPHDLPGGPGNLAHVAALALAERAGIGHPEASIRIEKRIPVAAGMGGGSADAAATMRGLNVFWGCGLDDRELAEVAAAVGADVPAAIVGGAVFADGHGIHVTPVHAATTWWVVTTFDVGVSTADAYVWWDGAPATGPDPGALIAAIETGNVELLGSLLFNDLQGAVASRHPEVAATVDRYLEAGALGAVMTGSGPTVAALARHVGHAAMIAEALPGSLVVTAPVQPMPAAR